MFLSNTLPENVKKIKQKYFKIPALFQLPRVETTLVISAKNVWPASDKKRIGILRSDTPKKKVCRFALKIIIHFLNLSYFNSSYFQLC